MRWDSGDRHAARVALATCRDLPELDEDSRRLIEPLKSLGVSVAPAIWGEESTRWTNFELVVVRSCWDYVERRSEFLSWARRVPQLANSAAVLAWNSDKRYLRKLASLGIPTIPTEWIVPGDQWLPPGSGEIVIKPAVSLCALNTGRYRMNDATERELARAHVRRLQSMQCITMVQPYFRGVDKEGETSLVYMGGTLAHSLRKEAVLDGPDTGVDRRFESSGGQRLTRRNHSADQAALATQVLAEVPGGPDELLYARVDLIPGCDGRPVLMEVELIEPQLYFGHVPGSEWLMARAIAERVSRQEKLLAVAR